MTLLVAQCLAAIDAVLAQNHPVLDWDLLALGWGPVISRQTQTAILTPDPSHPLCPWVLPIQQQTAPVML